MTEIRYLKLTPEGQLTTGTAPGNARDLLDTLYEVIGCNYVDAVMLGHDGLESSMYVDDEGFMVEEPELNRFSTEVVYAFNKVLYQNYCGTAVFLGPVDRHGNDTSITDDVVERIGLVVKAVHRELRKRGIRVGDQ